MCLMQVARKVQYSEQIGL